MRILRKLKRWSNRKQILAVPNDSLQPFLASLGLLESLELGKLTCHVCDEPLDMHSVQYVARRGIDLVIICSKASCAFELGDLRSKE